MNAKNAGSYLSERDIREYNRRGLASRQSRARIIMYSPGEYVIRFCDSNSRDILLRPVYEVVSRSKAVRRGTINVVGHA